MSLAFIVIIGRKVCVQMFVDVITVDHDILLHVMNVAVRLLKVLINIDFAPI